MAEDKAGRQTDLVALPIVDVIYDLNNAELESLQRDISGCLSQLQRAGVCGSPQREEWQRRAGKILGSIELEIQERRFIAQLDQRYHPPVQANQSRAIERRETSPSQELSGQTPPDNVSSWQEIYQLILAQKQSLDHRTPRGRSQGNRNVQISAADSRF